MDRGKYVKKIQKFKECCGSVTKIITEAMFQKNEHNIKINTNNSED